MAYVDFIRGTTSGISETPLVDGQLIVDTDKREILLDVEDASTHDVERLSMNSIPAGGAAGQVLKKASAADRDVTWGNAASGGGHTIVDGDGTDMADEDDLQFTGGLTVTDDDTNGRTVVDASGKMNTDGSNAANHVTFSGAFTVGSRGNGTVGTNSVAEGSGCSARGNYSHAEGYNNYSYSYGSHSEGGYLSINSIPSPVRSGVFLNQNITSNSSTTRVYASTDILYAFWHTCVVAITIGDHTAIGYISSKEKDSSKYIYTITFFGKWGGSGYSAGRAVDYIEYSYSNAAYGFNSHAEGQFTCAIGDYSHAEGNKSLAAGNSSHAEGNLCTASEPCAHAEGYYTKTGAAYQHVQGICNVGRNDTLFEIGNGTSNSNRGNAFEVYSDGSLSTDNGVTKVKLEDLPSKNGGETYTFHITNTVASNTGVAWCNKVAKFSAPSRAETGVAFTFYVSVKVGDTITALAFDNVPTITAIYLYDKATAKISNLSSANFTYTESIDTKNNNKYIVFTFTIAAASVTAANATALNAVIDSESPGFAAIYAANNLNLTGTIKGKGIVEKIPGFPSAFNTFPTFDHMTQHIGDFYFPTGGPRWSIDVEVDPGTAYMAVCYLENTTTGAYFNHSICYAGVGVPTLAAPTVAPAPVAGKVIAFVGTTWTPFVAGVAGVVTDGVVTTKPRLRIVGYHANNAPTAGLGMHLRLFRIY